MTMWPFGGRQVVEQLARLERSAKEQGKAIGRQQEALTTLAETLARLEVQLARVSDRMSEDGTVFRAAVTEGQGEVERRLEQVGLSLKRATGADKRVLEHVGTVSEQMKRLLGRLARVSQAFDPSIDEAFVASVQPLVESRRTMLGYDRLFTLWQAARNVAPLGLPAAEIGTFRGGSAALISQALRARAGAPIDVHVVDTFEGHLDTTFTSHDPEQQRGKFTEVTFDDVRAFLSDYPGTHVYKGDGPTVVRGWPDRQYALVHIDVDLYQPTLECLGYFAPRVVSGGMIVMDDYEAPTCPGVAVAVHEYLAGHPDFQTWRLQAEQLVLVRR
jgi:hypothetical protein